MKARKQSRRTSRLTQQQEQELKNEASDCLAKYAEEKAANPSLPALAPSEIYEIYGSPMLILHPPTKTM
jgi:hypothetical protein